MEIQFQIPAIENTHYLKNPFTKLAPNRPEKVAFKNFKQAPPPLKKQGEEFVIRCESGFKSVLKNKDWKLTKVPHPEEIEPTVGSMRSEETTLLWFDSSNEIKKVETMDPQQSSFAEDCNYYRALCEYHSRVTPSLARSFQIISEFPEIKENDFPRKKILLPSSRLISSGKTIFLDLDNTLVFSCNEHRKSSQTPKLSNSCHKIKYYSVLSGKEVTKIVKCRKGTKSMLRELSHWYEIVIFSSAEKNYVISVVKNILDKKGTLIDAVLSREHCVQLGEYFCKDLSIIGNRELDQMVLVDNSVVSFFPNLDNGFLVPTYCGNSNDPGLYEFTGLLVQMANAIDIRQELRNIFLFSDLYKVFLAEKSNDARTSER